MPVSSESVKEMLATPSSSEIQQGEFKCPECPATFATKQRLGSHSTSHRVRNCRFCDKEQNLTIVGNHEKWCHHNPNRGVRVSGDAEKRRESDRARKAKARNAKKSASSPRKAASKVTPIKSVQASPEPAVDNTIGDVESLLSLMFPNGIPTEKFQKAVEWVALTEDLLR